ncbi:MAG TPA: hypothetical protein VGA45_13255, partial [Actinomycetota bacterium]
ASPAAASPAAATVPADQRSAWPVAAIAGVTMVALVGGALAVRTARRRRTASGPSDSDTSPPDPRV